MVRAGRVNENAGTSKDGNGRTTMDEHFIMSSQKPKLNVKRRLDFDPRRRFSLEKREFFFRRLLVTDRLTPSGIVVRVAHETFSVFLCPK